MQSKGTLLLLGLAFVLMSIYFGLFGFSYDKYWKYGQYLSLLAVFMFFIDEFFKE